MNVLPFDTWCLSKKCVTIRNVCFLFRIQSSSEARQQALRHGIEKLPQANFDNLRYLIKFLSVLSRNQEVNKMTSQNIAIVIAPNLIWSQADETSTMGWVYYMHSPLIYNIKCGCVLSLSLSLCLLLQIMLCLRWLVCQPLTLDTWVWCQVTAFGICDGQSGTETGFSLSTSVYPCHYHSMNVPYSFILLSQSCHLSESL